MRDRIFEAIYNKNGKMTFKMLSKRFNIDSQELKNILLELKLDGKILEQDNKYMIFPDDLKIGTVVVLPSGNKYILYNDMKLTIPSDFFNSLILNDVVCFKFVDKENIELISIIDRPLSKMTCTVMNINGKKQLVPYHEGLRINLPLRDIKSLSVGDIILVDLTSNEIDDYCNATFIKKIGRINDPNIYDKEVLFNYGFTDEYSDKYNEELGKYPEKVTEEEIIGRHDFRNQKSCTIDGIDTKDMDDSVYAKIIKDNIIRVYVHIADVSHYIKMGSEAFKRACDVTTSVYTNDSVFHMLHYIISNGICSLKPNEDRLTKTVILDIDKDGNIVDYNIVKSVINSKKKMTYEDVDQILLNNNIPGGYEDFVSEILILKEAANRLEKRYSNSGKIKYQSAKSSMSFNDDGTVCDINTIGNTPSEKIIEYLMIAANETVANWLLNIGIPAIFRIHEAPNIKTINEIIDEVNKSGFNIKHVTNIYTPKYIQRLFDKVKKSNKFPLIAQMLELGMKHARYSTNNIGHYALLLSAYMHFTSPIRRLADLIVHMIIDLALDNYEKILEYDLVEIETELEKLAVHASVMERRAAMVESDCEKNKVIRYMSNYIDNKFEAIVCETNQKVKIRINNIDTYIDANDFECGFAFDDERQMFYEVSSGCYLKIGTKILVRLESTNIANKTFKVKVLEVINNKKKVRKKETIVVA